jgi:hypothetical protein
MIEIDTFTRPANTTAYAQGDLIANDATAVDVVPLQFGTTGSSWRAVRQARLHKTSTTTTGADYRLWLLNADPTVTNGDNGALAGDWSASVVGVLEGSTAYAASDGVVLFMDAPGGVSPLVSGPIYGLLEARASYTPASAEVFTLTLETAPGRNIT